MDFCFFVGFFHHFHFFFGVTVVEEVVDLLVGAGLADSKGAARRSIKEGGAYVNNVRIEDEAWSPAESDYLHGAWLVLRRGKKNFAGAKRV